MSISINFLDELKARSLALKDSSRTNETLDWNTPYELVCSRGHSFISPMKSVIRLNRAIKPNAGCVECYKIDLGASSLAVAQKNMLLGHKILATELRETDRADGQRTRYYQVACQAGHSYWKATAELSKGCPTCNERIYVGQEKVRFVLESHFKKPFKSAHPDWFVNPGTGRTLELDGYNDELQIAFEFQGKQHLSNNTQYANDFEAQVKRDELKKRLCSEHGVRLLVINQPSMYASKQFFESIQSQLVAYDIFLDSSLEEKMKNFSVLGGHAVNQKFTDFKKYVEERGYKLNSKNLDSLGGDELSFSCSKEHEFKMTGERFKQHYGVQYKSDNVSERCPCHICKKELANTRQKIDLKHCESEAKKIGWSVLSTEYKQKNAPMKFMCQNGHEVETTFRLFERSIEQNGSLKCKLCEHEKKLGVQILPKKDNPVQVVRTEEPKADVIDEGPLTQIEMGLANPIAEIRKIFVMQPTYKLTEAQVERVFNDESEEVQLALIQRADFIPTEEQILQGSAHSNPEIKRMFTDFPTRTAWEYYQESKMLKAQLASLTHQTQPRP